MCYRVAGVEADLGQELALGRQEAGRALELEDDVVGLDQPA